MAISLLQPSPFSLPVGVILLTLLGLLLLAMALGGLLALRLRSAPMPPPSPWEDILNILPLPAALVRRDGRPVVANAEAAAWFEPNSPSQLNAHLSTLVRRVVSGHQAETAQVTLSEGPATVRAVPLPDNRSPVLRALRSGPAVLLVGQPGGGQAGLHLTRLVAHELRTPLTAIVGHADVLESCSPADEALWRRSRDFIAAETKRLARLVEDLLTLSRLDASPPLTRSINLRGVAESALALLYDRAEATGLTLTLDTPANLPRVCADPDRIQQALVNLVDNAVKYTPPDGTVTLKLVPEGGYIRAEVSDTGIGIAPEDLPHLFEPLYRAENARSLPGAGLGLTIVRAILEQHGSSIFVQSRPEKGATFIFRLPVAR